MPEFSGIDLHRFVVKHYGDEFQSVIDQLHGWLAQGKGIAVYENADLGHPNVGEPKIVTFGPGTDTWLEGITDPIQLPQTLPDTTKEINWRYQLVGWYSGEPGSIEEGQYRPVFPASYIEERRAEIAAERART